MCFDERKIDSRARPWAARRIARRTCALRLAVRSLSLDMVRFLLLLPAVHADGDQVAQQLARFDCPSIHGIHPLQDGRPPQPRRGVAAANDNDVPRPEVAEQLGDAHFFFPSLRKMYSPACLMPLAL